MTVPYREMYLTLPLAIYYRCMVDEQNIFWLDRYNFHFKDNGDYISLKLRDLAIEHLSAQVCDRRDSSGRICLAGC